MNEVEIAAKAHEVIDRCIKVPIGREDKNCGIAIETKFAFQDYVGRVKSDLDYAKALTGFLHRGWMLEIHIERKIFLGIILIFLLMMFWGQF